MRFLLSESFNQQGFGQESFLKIKSPHDVLIEVGPRINIVTAWCTNAVGSCGGVELVALYIPIEQHYERSSHRDEQAVLDPLLGAHLPRRGEVSFSLCSSLTHSDPARRNDGVGVRGAAAVLRHVGAS